MPPPGQGPIRGFIRAPEPHRIDSRWIVYFAASPSSVGEDVFRIRTLAIVCDDADPMTGNWSVLGRLVTTWNTSRSTRRSSSTGASATSLGHSGSRGSTPARTCTSPPPRNAADPRRQGGTPVHADVRPGYPRLQRQRGTGTARPQRQALPHLLGQRDGCAILHGHAHGARRCRYHGPGHNRFTTDGRGRDLLVHHARDYEAIVGAPLFDPNRHTRVQRFAYATDGTPRFGSPVVNGQLIA